MRMSDRRSRIDEAIDRAVRELTHHDPRPGMRRRVLAAIDAPARRSAAVARLTLAAAVLAALVLAVLILRKDAAPEPTPVVATHTTPPAAEPSSALAPALAPAPAPAPAPALAPASAPTAAPARAPRREAIPKGRVVATSLPDDPPATFVPIVVAPLAPRPVDVMKIPMPPLPVLPR